MPKRKIRIHGEWKDGEEVVITDRPDTTGIYDGFTPALLKAMNHLSAGNPFLSGALPEGTPIKIVEVEVKFDG